MIQLVKENIVVRHRHLIANRFGDCVGTCSFANSDEILEILLNDIRKIEGVFMTAPRDIDKEELNVGVFHISAEPIKGVSMTSLGPNQVDIELGRESRAEMFDGLAAEENRFRAMVMGAHGLNLWAKLFALRRVGNLGVFLILLR